MPKFTLLILSAGFGKRMLDLTTNTPKPLLKFKNQTLLGNTINFFKDIGCNEIFINTHYLHEKIHKYVNTYFNDHSINLIYEPKILGTGGAIKNIFKYSKNKKICVVNSDIFWQEENKVELLNFLKDFNNITHCKILLSKNDNFHGLKKTKGDFNIENGIVKNWIKDNQIFFYSGFQIVSKNIFKNMNEVFAMNIIWNKLIIDKNLKGSVIQSEILHIGDKNSFHNL